MNKTENDNFFDRNHITRERRSESSEFSAPLGAISSARLVFATGASRLRLTADAALPSLFHASFKHDVPDVWAQDGIVTVRYRRRPILEQLINWRRHQAFVSLNGSIPWELELRGGVSQLNADLSEVQLGALDILGGASQIRMVLAKAAATQFIYISGGISEGQITVPSGTALRIQISGGASRLAFDGQRFGAIGGETRLESPGFANAASRYDISIAGGASNLTVERKR